MRARTKRLWIFGGAAIALVGAVALTLTALNQTMSFFYTPSDIVAKGGAEPGERAKLGGLVAVGSLEFADDGRASFKVIDDTADIRVSYFGIIPDLFREGQGVVAEGQFAEDGSFEATRLLAKHDENYIPREVADSLKERGEWRNEGGDYTPES